MSIRDIILIVAACVFFPLLGAMGILDPENCTYALFITLAIILMNPKEYVSTRKSEFREPTPVVLKSESIDKDVELKIKKIDENFQEESFTAWVKNTFLKYLKAFEKKDWESISAFSTNEFVEKAKQNRINNQVKNKTRENGGIDSVTLLSFEQKDGRDYLKVKIKYHEIKVEYNVATGEKIKGLSGAKISKTCYVLLERNTGTKTYRRHESITNCPKCGAPTHIITSGKCTFCGSTIKVESENWRFAEITFWNV